MEQQKKTERTDEQMEVARLRFGMIAPVIQETYPDESVMAYCRRVSQTPMRLPDGRTVKYKPKTIGKWVSLYRNGGIDALTPKTRSDQGKTRVLSEEAIDEIYRIRQKYPRLNATQIHARLVQESLIPATVSVATIQSQLDMICASIGTVLLHTPVRDGASKGKVERNFRTLKERWLYGLDISQIRSLDEFNELLAAYIRKHNTTEHSTTGDTPLSRYLHSGRPVRKPQSAEWLEECFLNRTTRRVSRDATVELDSRCYDAPMQFIGQKVEVRYLPEDPEKVWVFSEGKKYPLRLTDRVGNGKTKRENHVSIDYSTALGGGEDVH